jgi:DNA-binding response OmpR family regulator
MVSTRKRKSTRSTDDYSKKAKSEEELTATVKENEQQVEEQENQKTEEDSPTKKIAAANVLMAFSDTAGETTKEEADASGIKGTLTLNETSCLLYFIVIIVDGFYLAQ